MCSFRPMSESVPFIPRGARSSAPPLRWRTLIRVGAGFAIFLFHEERPRESVETDLLAELCGIRCRGFRREEDDGERCAQTETCRKRLRREIDEISDP